MSIGNDNTSYLGFSAASVPSAAQPPATNARPLHRIDEIRRRQGVTIRSAARRMGESMEQVRSQQKATCDMPLSQLHKWQKALEVPIAELLVDLEPPLSQPVLTRARLLKVMKTVRAISEVADSDPILRFCHMLEDQLVELMPELKDVSPWHSVGQRRTQDELGRAAERSLPESFFSDFTSL